MNINSPFPLDVDALIAQLDKIFPDRSPNISDSDREVWLKAGQASAVAFLKAWRKASLEKHPYVRREDTQGVNGGERGEARTGLHQPVLRGPRRGRRGRKARQERPAD